MKAFFVVLTLAGSLALGYVHQKVCLVTLGYRVEALGRQRDELLDQHRVLNYNVLALRSPVILEERLAQQNIQLAPPKTIEVLSPPPRAVPSVSMLHGVVGPVPSMWRRVLELAANWLGNGQQAVAEPAGERKGSYRVSR